MHNLVLRLLHQNVQPFAQIRRHHVHQPETRDHLVPRHLELLRVEEYELHLHDRQDNACGRRQCDQHVLAAGDALQLKVLAKLETRVHHAADAEGHSADAQIEAAILGDRFAKRHLRVSAIVLCASENTEMIQMETTISNKMQKCIKLTKRVQHREERSRPQMCRVHVHHKQHRHHIQIQIKPLIKRATRMVVRQHAGHRKRNAQHDQQFRIECRQNGRQIVVASAPIVIALLPGRIAEVLAARLLVGVVMREARQPRRLAARSQATLRRFLRGCRRLRVDAGIVVEISQRCYAAGMLSVQQTVANIYACM